MAVTYLKKVGPEVFDIFNMIWNIYRHAPRSQVYMWTSLFCTCGNFTPMSSELVFWWKSHDMRSGRSRSTHGIMSVPRKFQGSEFWFQPVLQIIKYFNVRKWYPQECVPCKSHCLLTLAELWPDGSQCCFLLLLQHLTEAYWLITGCNVALGLEVRSLMGLTADVRGSVGLVFSRCPKGDVAQPLPASSCCLHSLVLPTWFLEPGTLNFYATGL